MSAQSHRIALVVTVLAATVLVLTGHPTFAGEPSVVTAAPDGPFGPPVTPLRVTAPYDPPAERWLTGHRGVDVAAEPGQEVRAAGSGVVVFAGPLADRGVVSIDHGTVRTTYEPVDAAVSPGQVVAAGTTLGTIGAGAHCSLRCLHWGARIGEEYIDPLALLADYRPVLKTPKE